MKKFSGILIALAVLVIAGFICSMSGSTLLHNASDALLAQSQVEAWRTARFMAGTIDKQSNALVFALVVVAAVVVLESVVVARMFFAGGLPGRPRERLLEPGAPKFLALDDRSVERLRRLPPERKAALLQVLYRVTSLLEVDLGYPGRPNGRALPARASQPDQYPPQW